MANLQVPIPMTERVFYPVASLAQNKAKLELIGKKWFKEIRQAEYLTKVPGALILSIIFTESAGIPNLISSAGACGLMQLKPQTGNDVIFLENHSGRLSAEEILVLRKSLGIRLDGPLKQKFLSHKIKENSFTGNVFTRSDLMIPELNVLLGAMYLGILIDQHQEAGILRLDKVLLRYGLGYFYKPASGSIEQVLDHVKIKSTEGYSYLLKVLGKNGLLQTQSQI